MEENRDISKLRIEKPTVAAARRKRRYSWWVAAAIIGAVALALIVRAVFYPSFEVKASTVSLTYPSSGLTLLNASGYVVAQRKAAVASKTTGRLVWIGVEEGSRVKKGQVIARLENEDVAAARSQSEANLAVAERRLDEARAELNDAEANFRRDRGLLASGIISRTEHDASEARYKKATAGVEAARATIEASKAALKAADVSVEYTLIRAPFDAVVLTKNADIGDIITPLGAAANAKAAVVTIADMDSLQVEADVSESNIAKVSINQPCEVQLDALPDERFNGKVHMIVPTADRTKASVLVKVRFLEKNPKILPEMSAKVSFLSREVRAGEEAPRVTVSPSSIVREDGKDFVYVISDDEAAKTPIVTGRKVGDFVEATSGVKPGDRVVISPPKGLKDGSKVTVIEG